MIVTNTQNADGHRRVYLGGKASLECYVAPKEDGRRWTFHLDASPIGNPLSPEQQRQWATYVLMQLAEALNVLPSQLADVPFEAITALHTVDPCLGRRVVSPKRRVIDNGFTATGPRTTKPEFNAKDHAHMNRRRF